MQAILLGRADQVPPEKLNIPLFLDRVPAGFPSPASDYCARNLDLNELCITKPAATYFVRAEGEDLEIFGVVITVIHSLRKP